MAEDLKNSENGQVLDMTAENPAADGEEYEYEYIELAEGEELPEDAEYEYVEVSDDEMPSMTPPSSAIQTETPATAVSAPESEAHAAEVVSEPVSAPAAETAQSIVPPVEEADLNALLDDNEEIQEVNPSTLLDGDYSDEFARNLFADKATEKIEEVSIDDILGADAADGPAGIDGVQEVSADDLMAGLNRKEDDGSLRRDIWSDLTDDSVTAADESALITEPVIEPAPVVESEPVVEPEPVAAPEPEAVAVPEPVIEQTPVVEPEPIVEPEPVVAPEPEAVAVPEPVIEQTPVVEPEPIVEPELVAVPEPEAVAVPEPVIEQTPVVEPEPIVEPEPVAVPEPEAVAAPEPVIETESVMPVLDEAEPDVYAAPENIVEAKPSVTEENQAVVTDLATTAAVQATTERPENSAGRVVQVAYQSVLLTDDVRAGMLAKDRVADENSGLQFFEMQGGSLLLNVGSAASLEHWHLIIFNQNLVPVEAGGAVEIVQPQDTIRSTTVVKHGTEKLEIYNEEEYRFTDPAEGFVPAQKHFIYGRTDDDTGLIVNDFVNIGLLKNAGRVIIFENPVFGWLSGPNGAQIYFAQLGKLAVSAPEQRIADEEKAKLHAAKWFSGGLDDKYFEFSASSQSGEFTGTDEIRGIHVNVGNSAYGWNVVFDNGLMMNLRDLQEFENKHGKMPSPNGEISHGALKLKFSNVEKIVVYQAPQYFAYGRN